MGPLREGKPTFEIMMNTDGVERFSCEGCSACCRHVAMPIDTPEKRRDYDEIAWFLLHEDVNVFIDHDDEWYVEFMTRCKALDDDRRCKVYDTRPQVCRDYDSTGCVRWGEGDAEAFKFTEMEHFLDWMKDRGFDYTVGKRLKKPKKKKKDKDKKKKHKKK